MKYTFISKEGPGLVFGSGTETERTVTFNAHQLDTILEEFELFLKGCGFEFDGHLDIISDDVPEDKFSNSIAKKLDVDMDGRC